MVGFVSKAISFSMNHPFLAIFFLFQLQCCGFISGYDIFDFVTITGYPITCCRNTLYDITNYHIVYDNQIDGRSCSLTQTVSKIYICQKTVHLKHAITVML